MGLAGMPLDPALRLNMRTHLREKKNDAGIRPPRPAKVNLGDSFGSGKPAMREYEAGCAAGRDPALRISQRSKTARALPKMKSTAPSI